MKKNEKSIVIFFVGSVGTNVNLFEELGRVLSERHDVRLVCIELPQGSIFRKISSILTNNLGHLGDILWADVAIFHVSLIFSAPSFLFSRALRKDTLVFQWDVYPTTLSGKLYKGSLVRRIINRVEVFLIGLTSVAIIPSEDFRDFTNAKRVHVLPLWPQSVLELQPIIALPPSDNIFNIAFAGQVNELRGLEEFLDHIRNHCSNAVALHLFSKDHFEVDLENNSNLEIVHHGLVTRGELQRHLTRMQFGLISLSPDLDQPGFPSKTFDYLAAGLPVLYYGRPLPGFTSIMEGSGVGTDITNMESVDLEKIHEGLAFNFDKSQNQWLDQARLDHERLTHILEGA